MARWEAKRGAKPHQHERYIAAGHLIGSPQCTQMLQYGSLRRSWAVLSIRLASTHTACFQAKKRVRRTAGHARSARFAALLSRVQQVRCPLHIHAGVHQRGLAAWGHLVGATAAAQCG